MAGQGIKIRREPALRAQKPHAVGTGGIQSEQNYIGMNRAGNRLGTSMCGTRLTPLANLLGQSASEQQQRPRQSPENPHGKSRV
jgi:hypothetical protein